MASISLVCGVALIAVIVVVILKKARKILLTSNWYKRIFADGEAQFAETTRKVFAPLKEKIFADLSEHLKTVKGDVLEIGIGSGENFDYYPHGTSLIAVDCNPHVQDRLKARLDKAADRVHLKKFVVASAAQLDVDDNSVAAVVCTLVVCSIDDDQTRKTLQEVKRVLKPVSNTFVSFTIEPPAEPLCRCRPSLPLPELTRCVTLRCVTTIYARLFFSV